jgi:ABC-type branched-subunit amino acid transport system ATPase component
VDAVGLPVAKMDAPAGSLSTGQRKRLEIARLLVGHRPRLILLDEPTAGIDRAGIPLLASVLRAVQKGTSASLVVVDHDQDFLLSVAPEVICLGNGKIVDIVRADDTRLTERLGAAVRRPVTQPEVGSEVPS